MEYVSLGLAGLIGYMIGWTFANLSHLGRAAVFVEKIGGQTLNHIVTVAQDIEFIRAMKYDMLEDSTEPATLIRQRNIDEYEFDKWKKSIVNTYVSSYPQFFKQQVSFDDWDGAVQHIEKSKKRHR